MRKVKLLIELVVTAVAYVRRYIPTNRDVRGLARRLSCSPRDLAAELHITSSVFGQTGRKHIIRRLLLYEWFLEDPHASSIKLILHLINLDELDTIDWWLKKKLTQEEKTTIDKYHLELLSKEQPSLEALFVTARVIIGRHANTSSYQLIRVLAILGGVTSTSQLIRSLRQVHQPPSKIVDRLRQQRLGNDYLYCRAAEVLRMRALTELNLCVLPTEDEPVSDAVYDFVVNHLVCSTLPSNPTFPLLQKYDSYLKLLSRLKHLNQHYAVAMVLMMTGSHKRDCCIKKSLPPTIYWIITYCNNEMS